MRAGSISGAVQPAVHDVFDGSVARSWLNSPLSHTLETDIYAATNIAKGFVNIGQLGPERRIPGYILGDAAGFALLSVAKVSKRLVHSPEAGPSTLSCITITCGRLSMQA